MPKARGLTKEQAPRAKLSPRPLETLQRHETFALQYFKLGIGAQAAVAAGYSPKTARVQASILLTNPNVQAHLEKLRQEAKSKLIMGVVERQERLSELARARLVDLVDSDGLPAFSPDTPGAGAISELTTRTGYDKEGNAVTTRKVKLHSPTQAIDLLNKMNKLYGDTPAQSGPVTNNIIVLTPDALAEVAALIQQIHSQAGPIELLPTGDGVFSADQGILRDG